MHMLMAEHAKYTVLEEIMATNKILILKSTAEIKV